MTFILGVCLNDHVLVLRDSQVIETIDDAQTTSKDEKLWPIDNLPIVWGYVGSHSIGTELRRWIDRSDLADCESWEALRDHLARELGRLNQSRKLRAREAGAPDTDQDETSAIFAGYVRDEPLILLLDPTGDSQFESSIAYDGLTAAKANAKIAIALANALGQPPQRDASSAVAVANAVIEVTLGLEGPVQLWEVTPSGATRAGGE